LIPQHDILLLLLLLLLFLVTTPAILLNHSNGNLPVSKLSLKPRCSLTLSSTRVQLTLDSYTFEAHWSLYVPCAVTASNS